MRALRPHQSKAIALLRDALRSGSKRPMLMAPTGAGKTVLAASIIDLARTKGSRVIFTVPAITLVDQTVREFYAEGIRDVGVIQADHPMTDASKPVQIASIDTLRRRELPPAQLVIVDEAHRKSAFLESWLADEDWLDVPFIGLSATPWSKGLGRLYDRLIIAATTAELIEKGYLSRFRVFAPSHPDLSGVRTARGDYVESELSEAMRRGTLVADVVETWLRQAERRPTLCFAVDRVHAKTLQTQFLAAGVRCGYLDARTPTLEREAIRKQFQAKELEVVCNVGVLTTGVDWDVRCIVLARPTKSEILYTQIIGRGLRTAEGKDDCLARDTLVLTDRGEVRIQDVTLDHKVWDGVAFVAHAGAVCRGVRPVISHDGLTATPDHRVMTNVGWVTLAEAHRRGLRVARTGMGGRPLRFVDRDLATSGGFERQAASGGILRALRALAHGAVPQHAEAAQHGGLPSLQRPSAGEGASLALSPLPSATRPVSESALDLVRSIWRAWDRVPLLWAERGGDLDCREPWHRGSLDGDRPHRQQRPLRAGQSPLGASGYEHREQQAFPWWSGALCRLQDFVSRGALRRSNADEAAAVGHDRPADHRPLEHPFAQAEGEVWDILNAGPLQRFTANGRLVHNCLILDHSDTTLRLGFVTDIHHAKLDDGTLDREAGSSGQETTPPKPRECKFCHFVMPPRTSSCPSCGKVPERRSEVETVDGELVDLTAQRRANQQDWAEKVAFIGQLRAYAIRRNKSDGWVSAKYRAKFGVWPNDHRVKYARPAAAVSPEVASWLKSQAIRWAKAQEKAKRQGAAA